MSKRKNTTSRRPKILVLESLGGSCVYRAGGQAVEQSPYNLGSSSRALEAEWDGLLLTGGSDIDPRIYGQKPHKRVYGISRDRDLVEQLFLEEARKRDVPVLGICRGAQMMNAEAGGTLVQHIKGHRGGRHLVVAAGLLRKATGLESFQVVSLHHQCVAKAAPGWDVVAIARDRTPEAVASRDGRCLGVQFHPEMDSRSVAARAIFRWLTLEAARRAKLSEPSIRRQKPHQPRPERFRDQLNNPFPTSLFEDVKEWGAPHRTAGTKTTPRSGMKVSWICPKCGIIFDKQNDRDDHVRVLHR